MIEKPGHDTIWKVEKYWEKKIKMNGRVDGKRGSTVSHEIKRDTGSEEEVSQGAIEIVRGV